MDAETRRSNFTSRGSNQAMWVPLTVEELETVVNTGTLQESATFDTKELIGKGKDVAKDIAAMSTDGGVLIYGVAEDENNRPTRLTPIDLNGAAERIAMIVANSISEPPSISVMILATKEDASKGYLVVVVPPSARAPHMVIVDKDNRYYGRTEAGNIPLTEGPVARLYERRQSFELNTTSRLLERISNAPLPPRDDAGYLHVAAWPLMSDRNLIDKARRSVDTKEFLNNIVERSKAFAIAGSVGYSPMLVSPTNWRRVANGWRTYNGHAPEDSTRQAELKRDPNYVLDLQINDDGSAWLFCGRAIVVFGRDQTWKGIFEGLVAGLTGHFVRLLGELYRDAAYLGPVDMGAAVTGLQDVYSGQRISYSGAYDWPVYPEEQYLMTSREAADRLYTEPRAVAQTLIMPLVRTTTQERFNPWN